jgi:flagellar motility protein MotE (MotC chaperone)
MPNIRLIPIVLFAATSLLVLKTVALLERGGYTVGALYGAQAQDAAARKGDRPEAAAKPAPPPTQRSWAQDMLGYPEVTGSVGGGKPAGKPPEAKPAEAEKPNGQVPAHDTIGHPGKLAVEAKAGPSAGERAVLENLQERRQQLEARGRELDMREGLLKAAEQRVEARLQELKAKEADINIAMKKKDEAEAARFKGLVTMYETMKPKDAARIFDRLDLRVLLDVASQINPRQMSEILAQMSPEAAERLTIELAGRASGDAGKPVNPLTLPKIEGRPRS